MRLHLQEFNIKWSSLLHQAQHAISALPQKLRIRICNRAHHIQMPLCCFLGLMRGIDLNRAETTPYKVRPRKICAAPAPTHTLSEPRVCPGGRSRLFWLQACVLNLLYPHSIEITTSHFDLSRESSYAYFWKQTQRELNIFGDDQRTFEMIFFFW
jgi:hypothetical protein